MIAALLDAPHRSNWPSWRRHATLQLVPPTVAPPHQAGTGGGPGRERWALHDRSYIWMQFRENRLLVACSAHHAKLVKLRPRHVREG